MPMLRKSRNKISGVLYVELAAVMVVAMLLGGTFFDFTLGIRRSVQFADHINRLARHLAVSSDSCRLSCPGVIDNTSESFDPTSILSNQALGDEHLRYRSIKATFKADIDWSNLILTIRGSVPSSCVLCNTVTESALFSSVSRVRLENQNCALIAC